MSFPFTMIIYVILYRLIKTESGFPVLNNRLRYELGGYSLAIYKINTVYEWNKYGFPKF